MSKRLAPHVYTSGLFTTHAQLISPKSHREELSVLTVTEKIFAAQNRNCTTKIIDTTHKTNKPFNWFAADLNDDMEKCRFCQKLSVLKRPQKKDIVFSLQLALLFEDSGNCLGLAPSLPKRHL